MRPLVLSMFPFKPLLAVDWVDLIIFLIIVISSLIGQLFKGNKPKPQKPKPVRPRPKPRPPIEHAPEMAMRRVGDAGGGRVQAEPAKTALEREIEEFLQRHRPGQPAQAGRAGEPPAGRKPPQPPRRKPTPPKPRPAPPVSRTRETVEPRLEPRVEATIRTTVAPTIGGSILGEDIDQADERLESRLHDVFDRSLGQLGGGTSSTVSAGTDAAVWERGREPHPLYTQLVQVLFDPQQIRTAIVLNEILRRPEERWS